MLQAPHVAPLTDFVRRLRASRGGDESIPWFDPTDAGVGARILLLLEAPGRRATAKQGSGFISADNNDPTAENAWRLYREASIDRRTDVVVWNVIPWYIGTDLAVRSWTHADVAEARGAIGDLFELLTNLRVVVLMGKAAQASWDRLGIETPVIVAPHPSPQNLNTRPQMRLEILKALVSAKRIADGDSVAPLPVLRPTRARHERVSAPWPGSPSDARGRVTAMSEDVLRARVAELVAEGLGGDAIKKALNRKEHRVMELWAEERARLDGVLNAEVATSANVAIVADTYTFGPIHDPDRRPRWELVAAIVYGDASRDYVKRVKALYEGERGPGSSSNRYAGRGRR